MTKSIALFGAAESFHPSRIGGTDSFFRRVLNSFDSDFDVRIKGIFYGNDNPAVLQYSPSISLEYHPAFQGAFQSLRNSDISDAVTLYIRPIDRLRYAVDRYRIGSVRFHRFLYSYPESRIRRLMKFFGLWMTPCNGSTICVSRRQYTAVKQFAPRTVHIFPPVPEDYFVKPDDKKQGAKTKINFIGRIDPRKGIREVVELFEHLQGDLRFDCRIYGVCIPENREIVEIRKKLKVESSIDYIEVDRHKYSPKIDELVRSVLKDTDIFIQPYRTLDSTVDTPLLLLEAMASSCAILTRPVGDVKRIYGPSEFIVEADEFVGEALRVVRSLSAERLQEEQSRVYQRINRLGCKANQVSKRFLNAILA
jgi:glycosyltransferase involved in cell wall biosynthesis